MFFATRDQKKDFKFFMIKTPTHAIGEKQSGFHLLQFFFGWAVGQLFQF